MHALYLAITLRVCQNSAFRVGVLQPCSWQYFRGPNLPIQPARIPQLVDRTPLLCRRGSVSDTGGQRGRWTAGQWRLASLKDGGVTEWLMVADCKSAGLTPYVGSNPTPTMKRGRRRGCSSVGRASAFQAEGRGFESRRPLDGRGREERRNVRNVNAVAF